jgi:hypothetical protein
MIQVKLTPQTFKVNVQPSRVGVELLQQGPPGPQGLSAAQFLAECGVTISSGTVVVMVNGLLYPADPTNPDHAALVVGISTQAGAQGMMISVYSSGELTGESLVQGSRYYVGLNGALTTTAIAPGATWAKCVGLAATSSTLVIQTSQPISF